MKKIFNHAKVILIDRILDGGIVVEDNKITEVFTGACKTDGEIIECDGRYLSPGFIDLHVHGGGGSDFMDGTEEAIDTVLQTHANYGTTAMLPTTLSSSTESVCRALKSIEMVQKKWKAGPRILGTHLEGNFFAMEHKGAQDPKYIFPPTVSNYQPLVSAAHNLKRISCAPELENACSFARKMAADGILVSAAHSNADYDQFNRGVEHGFSHVTHIYNAISYLSSPNYYGQIGVCEAALLLDEISVEVISDGRHLPWQLLKLIYKIKGPERMNLCTDAMRAAGLPEGNYTLGDLEVVVKDEVAVLKDENTFAGSVCTSNKAVRTMYHLAGIPLLDAVRMITATPAKLIKEYHRLGSIQAGKLADINIFDEDINICYTMIDGKTYYSELGGCGLN